MLIQVPFAYQVLLWGAISLVMIGWYEPWLLNLQAITLLQQDDLHAEKLTCDSLVNLESVEAPSSRRVSFMIRGYSACRQSEKVVLLGQRTERNPQGDFLTLYLVGLAYNRLGERDDAAIVWQRLSAPAETVLNLRHEAKEDNDIERLLDLVPTATTLVPQIDSRQNPYRAVRVAANDYEDWGFLEQAAQLHEFIAQHLSPDTLDYWYARSRAAYLRGDIGMAHQFLTQAKGLWPYEQELYIRDARWLAAANRWSDALTASLDWAEAFPEEVQAYHQVAEVYYRIEDYENAAFWFNQVLTFNLAARMDVFNHAHRRLGNMAYLAGDPLTALAHFEQMQVRDVNVVSEQSHALWAVGRQDEAIVLLETAVKLAERQGNCPTTLFKNIGDWQQSLVNFEKAYAAYEQALHCDPNNDQLQELLEQLND